MVIRDRKLHNSASSLFLLLIIIRSGRLAEIRWSVCMSKSHWSLCVWFSRTDVGLWIYHLFVWSKLNFLHNFPWITLLTQSCLVLYSFRANLQHSLIIVSSLSLHNLHLLFCCVLSILALIWLVLIVLFCAAIRRDSVSLLRFPFLSHIHIFSCEMLLIIPLKTSIELIFIPFLFSGYCRSVYPRVVSIVSRCCNQSFSALTNSNSLLYICIYIIINHNHHHHQVAQTARSSLTLSFSPTIRSNHLSFMVGFLDCIQCPHRAYLCKFLLIVQV